MSDYKKHAFGEATKGVTAAVVGALLLLAGQNWFASDLEYKTGSRDAYLSAPLGEQGLTMAFDGKPLKNVSIFEFSIVNRTQKQVSNAELLFTVIGKDSPKLVAGGVIAPRGLSSAEVVEELQAIELTSRKFRLKVIPKQQSNEFFHAVFVFEGERAPEMAVSSVEGDVAIGPYHHWKDTTLTFLVIAGVILVFAAVQITVMSLADYFFEPRKHKKQIERFVEHAEKLRSDGKLELKDDQTLADAEMIYASFTEPKPSKFWSKIFRTAL